MKPADQYKELINQLKRPFEEKGFLRKGDCFYLHQSNNWGLIDFQRSRSSSAERIVFTINVGVCSRQILEFLAPGSLRGVPSIEICHWRERIGFLLPEHKDRWWSVTSDLDFHSLFDDLCSILSQVAIPSVLSHLSDEQLRTDWLAGNSPGLTDIQRLVNLSVLLREPGFESQLRKALADMREMSRGKPTALMVQQHLKRFL